MRIELLFHGAVCVCGARRVCVCVWCARRVCVGVCARVWVCVECAECARHGHVFVWGGCARRVCVCCVCVYVGGLGVYTL